MDEEKCARRYLIFALTTHQGDKIKANEMYVTGHMDSGEMYADFSWNT